MVMAAWLRLSSQPGVAVVIVRAYRRAAPPVGDAPRWGRTGHWFDARGGAWDSPIAMFPAPPAYQRCHCLPFV